MSNLSNSIGITLSFCIVCTGLGLMIYCNDNAKKAGFEPTQIDWDLLYLSVGFILGGLFLPMIFISRMGSEMNIAEMYTYDVPEIRKTPI